MGCASHSLLIILFTAATAANEDLTIEQSKQVYSVKSSESVEIDYTKDDSRYDDTEEEDDEGETTTEAVVTDANNYCPIGYTEVSKYSGCDETNLCYSRKQLGFPYSCEYFDYFQLSQNARISGTYYLTQQNSLYGYYEFKQPGLKFRNLLTELSNPKSECRPCAVASVNYDDSVENCILNYNVDLSECDDLEVYSLCFYDGSMYNFCNNFRQICGRNCDCAKYQSKFLCETQESCNTNCEDCIERFIAYPLPSIILMRWNSAIYVIVQNPLKIAKRDNLELYCFSENPVSTFEQVWQKHVLTEMSFKGDVKVYVFNSEDAGLYWCEYFTYPNMELMKTDDFIFQQENSNSFILNATVHLNSDYTFIPYNIVTFTRDILLAIFSEYANSDLITSISIVNLYPIYDNNLIDLTYRINVNPNENLEDSFYKIKNMLSYDLSDNKTSIVDFSLSPANLCLAVVDSITNLAFPSTRIGRVAVPSTTVVDINGLPVWRQCSGSFVHGALWSDFNRNIIYGDASPITEELNALLNSTGDGNALNEGLGEIIEDAEEVIPLDVHLISEIVTQIVSSGDLLDCIQLTNNINGIMRFSSEVLTVAQEILNSTDTILYNYDLCLGAYANRKYMETREYYYPTIIQTDLVVAQIANIENSNINGMAVYKLDNGFSVQSLRGIESFQQVNVTNLVFATYLPISLLNTLKNNYDHESDMSLVTALYLNDALFNQVNEELEATYVVSMFIPNLDAFFFDETIPVYFNVEGNNLTCAYWHYGINHQSVSIFGSWDNQYESFDDTLKICNFNHMTHFSILINAPSSDSLNIISYIASISSIVGTTLIVLTALIFTKWREQSGTVLLLNYSITVLIQHILLLSTGLDFDEGNLLCTMIGIVTHYIVLVQFCWMLIISYVQYIKLVVVYEKHKVMSIIKFCLFSWLMPIVPVATAVYVAIDDYRCFLSGNSFYLGIVLPISVIILLNFIIFVRIVHSLFCANIKITTKQNEYQKVSVLIILFFLMGFTWIFGLIANFFSSLIFSYLFCILTASHGLIISIYFILLQKNTRRMWLEKICGCFSNDNYKRNSFSSSSK